jgi:hypothetical protein
MFDFLPIEKQPENVCIVRLTTSFWNDNKGINSRKSLTYLRRRSQGFQNLEEECSAIGPEDAMKTIINLDECEDGIYEVVACNISHDYESGHIDGWDFKLVKVVE